jgi:hypothetical protein
MLTRLALIAVLTLVPLASLGCEAQNRHRVETHETTETIERSEPRIVVE